MPKAATMTLPATSLRRGPKLAPVSATSFFSSGWKKSFFSSDWKKRSSLFAGPRARRSEFPVGARGGGQKLERVVEANLSKAIWMELCLHEILSCHATPCRRRDQRSPSWPKERVKPASLSMIRFRQAKRMALERRPSGPVTAYEWRMLLARIGAHGFLGGSFQRGLPALSSLSPAPPARL